MGNNANPKQNGVNHMQLREKEISGVKVVVQPHPYPDTSGTGKSGKRTRRNRILIIEDAEVNDVGNYLMFYLRHHEEFRAQYEAWLLTQPQLQKHGQEEEKPSPAPRQVHQ